MSYHPKGRNVIHNGNFNVWQRGTTFTSPGLNVFMADRWRGTSYTDGTITVTQDTGVPTVGSQYSTKIACTGTDATIASNQACWYGQAIETQDFWDMLAGRPIVLSFWVKSYQTGTFSVSLTEGKPGYDGNYDPYGTTGYCVKEYVINASATWEKKVVQFPPPSVLTFSSVANAACLSLTFGLALGADWKTSTLGAWTSGSQMASSNQTNFMSSTNNYWQISQVQLEAGTAATEFDAIPYADELARCQRYLVAYGGQDGYEFLASGLVMTTSTARVLFYLPTEMRAAPTPGYSAIGDFGVQGYDISSELTIIAAANIGKKTAAIMCTGTGTPWTGGTPATLHADNTTAARLYFSAEI
jgi:hypothetical protein